MIRGTTPTLVFGIPIDSALITSGYVTFVQGGTVVIDKSLASATVSDRQVKLTLTQAETLELDDSADVEIQMAIKTTHNEVLRSNIIRVDVERILKDAEI